MFCICLYFEKYGDYWLLIEGQHVVNTSSVILNIQLHIIKPEMFNCTVVWGIHFTCKNPYAAIYSNIFLTTVVQWMYVHTCTYDLLA